MIWVGFPHPLRVSHPDHGNLRASRSNPRV